MSLKRRDRGTGRKREDLRRLETRATHCPLVQCPRFCRPREIERFLESVEILIEDE
jgi:hypothetical protein